MNAATCPGCGDTHLCPGTAGHSPDHSLLGQIQAFVAATFRLDVNAVISTQAAWEAYRAWCADTGTIPYSQRRFIQAMNIQPGIRRVKRSTMRFIGITWKQAPRPGRHAAPEPALTR